MPQLSPVIWYMYLVIWIIFLVYLNLLIVGYQYLNLNEMSLGLEFKYIKW